MKQPTPIDFIVNVKKSSVSVTFKPNNSEYNFGRLADPEDIARYGPLSQPPNVSHGGHRSFHLIRQPVALLFLAAVVTLVELTLWLAN